MHVALYARVSTAPQQQEGTIASQVQVLTDYMHQQEGSLLPEHPSLDDGGSGTRLDRPGLDRRRDGAQRGEFDAVVVLSPDRFARNDAQQWLLMEECEKGHLQLVFLQHPCGDTPQGKLLPHMQGMIAEDERAPLLERTRRGRWEKARRGACLPWAYRGYGYRSLPKRHGCLPQVVIDLEEAEVVRRIYRLLVEDPLRGRQMTKRLNEAQLPPPSGPNQVWQPATVRHILTNQVYAGQARDNYRQPGVPKYRQKAEGQLRSLTTGRHSRPESEWSWSEAPAIIPAEVFAKAPLQWRRNAESARKMSQPSSRRSLLRRLGKCGACGLAMGCSHDVSVGQKRYAYLYYPCKGHAPLTCGRVDKCRSRRVRADRLDTVVWDTLGE